MKEGEYQEIVPLIAQARGVVITQVIFMERMMDEILSRYFCQDAEKKKEIMTLILCTERITFESKRQVLKYIFENKYKDFLKKYPNLFKNTDEVMQERNILAHYLLDTSEGWAENYWANQTFGLVKFKVSGSKTDAEVLVYNEDKINKILSLTGKCTEIYMEFSNTVLT